MTSLDKNRGEGLYFLKLGCLVFWGCWFCLACTTNFFDFIDVLGGLSSDWRFRSGNYLLLSQTLSIYHLSSSFTNILFVCNTFIQGLSGVLFFYAAYLFSQRKNSWLYINTAFTLSIALWAVFIVMEEIFIAYAFEEGHRGLFAFELLTLISMHLLPQD